MHVIILHDYLPVTLDFIVNDRLILFTVTIYDLVAFNDNR